MHSHNFRHVQAETLCAASEPSSFIAFDRSLLAEQDADHDDRMMLVDPGGVVVDRVGGRFVWPVLVALLAACPGGDGPIDPGESTDSGSAGSTTAGPTSAPTSGEGPTTADPMTTSTSDDPMTTTATDGDPSSTGPAGDCGDGVVQPDEACDDGDRVAGDGCEVDCTETPGVVKLALGGRHTCALVSGVVHCWGTNWFGTLGQGIPSDPVGDDELPNSIAAVDVGAPVKAITAGKFHTCVLTEAGTVRCWGGGGSSQLGYGNGEYVGDDEPPSAAGDVDVGGVVIQVAAGGQHTCALLVGGKVRCWGINPHGQLGYGNTKSVGGKDVPPSSAGDVSVGGPVIQLSAGEMHTCAILEGGSVRCWGWGDYGALGLGDTQTIGDDEVPSSVDPVALGDAAVAIYSGAEFNCVLTLAHEVRCWGANSGNLGYGHTETIGDDEDPEVAGVVDFGGEYVIDLALGYNHACALLAGDTVRCWGSGIHGEMGQGNTMVVGDDETPGSLPPLDLGEPIVYVAGHANHTCARNQTNGILCWGYSDYGQLGYGNTQTIGDDESPATGGLVKFLP